jgi:hypothetical protein
MLYIYRDVLDTKWLERVSETVVNFSVCVYSWDSVYFDFVFVVLNIALKFVWASYILKNMILNFSLQ